ncbi:MAG: threonylcarbamoyl-AMP synthase [Paludibacteraceae bacterium]|nr:threonylcarbamoyl-AMP synthase [Paludibacteraceae bacterium]
MELRYDKSDLLQALEVLRKGGIILYPTDTVWGIGCDATNEEAVRKIFALKQRSDAKAMICLLDAPGKLQGYVDTVPEMAWDLIDCAIRPMTIIYPGAKNVAPSLIAEDGSLGIRITSEPFTQALCTALHKPLVSTSANISGEPTARNFAQISEPIRQGVDYIVQFRQHDMTEAQPSSIVKLGINNEVKVIRE